MNKRGDANAMKQTTINMLFFVVVILAALLVFTTYGIVTTRDNFTISIPPDIKNGAIVNVDEFDTGVVYGFASATFRELHRWENNGYVDYPRKIDELSSRFTAEYYEDLKKDMNRKNEEGELEGRSRYALELDENYSYTPGSDLVEVIDKGTWIVDVKIILVERVGDFEVKNRKLSYPLVVRRGNISPEKNIWGLLLDGYPKGRFPEEIPDEPEESTETG